MEVAVRPATRADVDFLTTVVIEATLHQGRLPDDFDEVDYRAGFGAWTAEQVDGDGAGSRGVGRTVVDSVLAQAREAGLPVELGVEKDNPRARAFWERCGFAYVGEGEGEHRMRLR